MRLKRPWTGIFLLALTPVLCGQNNATDLSGTWQLNLAKSRPPKFGKSEIKLKPATLSIQCTASAIQMRYETGGRVIAQTYIPDGKEKIVSEGHGGETAVKTHWKKGVLIVETSSRGYILGGLANQSHATELEGDVQRWSLSADGKTLSHEESNPKSLSIFDKIPEGTSAAPAQ
jgi:hypothetical protein